MTALRAAASNDTVSNDTASAAATASSDAGNATGAAGVSFSTSIDPGLGITVLKFFSSAGDLTQSFPSQKQLASYQVYGLDKSGAAPAAPDATATGHATGSVGQTTAPAASFRAPAPQTSAPGPAAPASAAPAVASAANGHAETAVVA